MLFPRMLGTYECTPPDSYLILCSQPAFFIVSLLKNKVTSQSITSKRSERVEEAGCLLNDQKTQAYVRVGARTHLHTWTDTDWGDVKQVWHSHPSSLLATCPQCSFSLVDRRKHMHTLPSHTSIQLHNHSTNVYPQPLTFNNTFVAFNRSACISV